MHELEPVPPSTLMRAHEALLKDLKGLRVMLRTHEDVPTAYRQLERLQHHVVEHFRCEEEGGYLEEVVRRDPSKLRVTEKLAEEHRRLAQALAELLEEVRWSDHLTPRLRDQIRRWVVDVRRHEARENHLIQDAYNRDAGPED